MITVANAAERQVAVVTAPKSIPVFIPNIVPDNTAGCTKMMYAIVKNVVSPASTSVRTVVWCSESRKNRSNIFKAEKSIHLIYRLLE